MWLVLLCYTIHSSRSFVPNFRILTQVVGEKSLTEKNLTDRQTDRQTDNQTQLQKRQKLYTPYILRTGGIITSCSIFSGSAMFAQIKKISGD